MSLYKSVIVTYYYHINQAMTQNGDKIMNANETIKECRKLAQDQNIEFKRSSTVGKINGRACYELESGIEYKILHQGCLNTIYETLLSEACANK